MKKVIAILLTLALVIVAFAACGGNSASGDASSNSAPASGEYANVKVGLICLHDENSTYDNNFIAALKSVQAELGLTDEQVLIKTNVGENDACLTAAEELVDAGCNLVMADSFGHESYMIQAAQEYPEVQFCHATGTSSKVKNIPNFHNAFASIYEGRFLAGIAAGMKLNEMIEKGTITAEQALIGYVGAFDYAEVVSGMTSFFLGARYVCPSATMKVTYTNAWFDIALEREAALNLINSGCNLISQHADSEGAPKACEEKGIPNVAYNIDTSPMGPNTALISSKINWAPYYKLAINAVNKGEAFVTDYCGSISTGSVELTDLNVAVAAAGTQEKIDEIKDKLVSGELKVFDTKTFTVDNEILTEYMADVDGDFQPDTNVINAEGYFDESGDAFRSAPYFDIKYIDGVSAL